MLIGKQILKGLKVGSKPLPSKEDKLIIINEQVYKYVAPLLDMASKKWHFYENKLHRCIRVIAKVSLFLKKKIIKDDLVNRKFNVKFVVNIIQNITVNNKKEKIKFPAHMLTYDKQESVEKICQIKDILE